MFAHVFILVSGRLDYGAVSIYTVTKILMEHTASIFTSSSGL
jgi:hypothetical protein